MYLFTRLPGFIFFFKGGILACLSWLGPSLVLAAEDGSARDRVSLNEGWLFQKGDPDGTGDQLKYSKIKDWILPSGNAFAAPDQAKTPPEGNPGEKIAYTQADYDDSPWRKLNLPHDWGVEGPFDQTLPGETGKLPWFGVAWYRKHFTVDVEKYVGRKYFLEIDGAMSYSTVWCNGHIVGGWPYGYSSYQLDLTPYLKAGAGNVLAIRLDNPPNSSRWYPGGGIYRNVWLVKTLETHIAHWGVQVTTPEITAESATVQIKVQVDKPAETGVGVKNEIFELSPDGRKSLAPVAGNGSALASGVLVKTGMQSTQLQVPNPKLWSCDMPNRYVVVTSVDVAGEIVDQTETVFGIRTVQFTADDGFHLNGQRVRIQGVCQHHDLGALGTAINTRALERQIEILKEMGVNAIRTSHNPPAPELLELCDRMGILVMDELVDVWKRGKKPNGYQNVYDDWSEKDLRAMIRRDRNHPCVILWSLGNEINEQSAPEGPAMQKVLADFAHEEDPTRPTTMGVSDLKAGYNGFQSGLDVFGYNYKPGEYKKFHTANPTLPLFGSETSSAISSRGEYFFPVTNNKGDGKSDFQMSSYDLYAPGWAMPPDWEFKGQDENPFVAGEFVWTGFDYIGEPTPYNNDSTNLLNYHTPEAKAAAEKELKELGKIKVPARSSYFGIVDLAGFKKDRFYLYQSRWRPTLPMVHILPHWNWSGREGEITPVHVYTSGDEAELFLNGQSLGRKKKAPFAYRLRWDEVKYAPGELKVVAYKEGREWATDTVKTTGPATRLLLQPDRSAIQADGRDLSFVTLTVVDAAGLPVPRSKNLIQFEIEGPGEIVATDNGDATDQTSFQSTERKAFNSLALVIVRAKPGTTAPITIRARAEGLEPAEAKIVTPLP